MDLTEMPDEDILKMSEALPQNESEVNFWKAMENYEEAEKIAEGLLAKHREETKDDERITVREEEVLEAVKSYILEKSKEFGRNLNEFDTGEDPITNLDELDHYSPDLNSFADLVVSAIWERRGHFEEIPITKHWWQTDEDDDL